MKSLDSMPRDSLKSIGIALLFVAILPAMMVTSFQANSAYAAERQVTISTYTGDTKQGTVGFSRDEMGAYDVTNIEAGEEVILVAEPAEGYQFYSWVLPSSSLYGVTSDSRWVSGAERSVAVYQNSGFVALFKSEEVEQHYVTVAYLTSETATRETYELYLVDDGEEFTLPEYEWAVQRMSRFAGWYWVTSGRVEEYGQPGDTIKVEEDIILHPVWRPYGNPCRIEFKCNAAAYKNHGIMSQMDSVTVEEGTAYELPKSHYVLTGWEFTGWYVVRPEDTRVESTVPGQWFFPDSEVLQPGDTIVVDSSLELWCQWEMIPHDHELEAVEYDFYDPCKVKGFETYWMCTVCGKIFSDADGKGEIAVPIEVPPLGHDLGEWVVTKEPTVTEEGEQYRVCKRDGCTYVERQVIDVLVEENNGVEQGSEAVEPGAQGDEDGTEGTQGDPGDGVGNGEGVQGDAGDASGSEGNSGSGDEASQGTEGDSSADEVGDGEGSEGGAQGTDEGAQEAEGGTQDSADDSQGTGNSSQGNAAASQGSPSGSHGSSGGTQSTTGGNQSSSGAAQSTEDDMPEESVSPEAIVWDEPIRDAAPAPTTRMASGSYAPVSSGSVSWTPGDDAGLNIVIEREAEKEDTFAHFVGVVVDGTRVAGTNYTATEGSLDLTLKPAFLETLASGDHVLRVVFDDGSVEMSFRVEEGAVVATAVAEPVAAIPWKSIILGFAALVVAAILVIFVRLRMLKMADSGTHTRVRR